MTSNRTRPFYFSAFLKVCRYSIHTFQQANIKYIFRFGHILCLDVLPKSWQSYQQFYHILHRQILCICFDRSCKGYPLSILFQSDFLPYCLQDRFPHWMPMQISYSVSSLPFFRESTKVKIALVFSVIELMSGVCILHM